MAYYVITAFDGSTLVTTGRDMVAMSESAAVMSRVGMLEHGVKFDADGTADADVGLGLVTARYRVTSTAAGMTSLNTGVAVLTALRGKHGTLTGVERMTSGDVTKTCTARCVDVIEEEYRLFSNPPMVAKYKQRTYVVMGWEKLTEWA